MSAWLSDTALDLLREVVPKACTKAGASLSQLAEVPVEVINSKIERTPIDALVSALPIDAGQPVTATMIEIEGKPRATIMLLFTNGAALALSSLLLGTSVPPQMDDMALSVLQEIGNVTGTSFLNVLAEALQERLLPTTPTVLQGPIATVLARSEPSRDGDVLLVHTTFRFLTVDVSGALVMLP